MEPIGLDEAVCQNILEQYQCFLFDCDGVLWRGPNIFPGAFNFLNFLHAKGKRIFFITNNSSKSRATYAKKLHCHGYQVKTDQIVSTSWLLAEYLKSIDFKGLVYVVGCQGIADELALANIGCMGVGPDNFPNNCDLNELKTELDPQVRCVAVGIDPFISYPKIAKAASYAQRENCIFIATNEDPNFPQTEPGIVIPGTGCIVSSIRVASGVNPIVLGKPHEMAWRIIERKYNLDPSTTMMVGDRLETDIAFGRNCGLGTMAVFSGHTSLDEIHAITRTMAGSSSKMVPQFYVESLEKFHNHLS